MGISFKKESFAARLKRLYESEPDRSLAKLGKIASPKGKPISAQGAQKWLTGKSVPASDKLRNIASHYHVTREWLLFGDSPKEPASMGIAAAADLLPEEDIKDLAKYALRLLDACKPRQMGPDHDRFMVQIEALNAIASETPPLKKFASNINFWLTRAQPSVYSSPINPQTRGNRESRDARQLLHQADRRRPKG